MSLMRTCTLLGGCATCFSYDIPGIVISLDGMRSSAVLSLFFCFFCEVAVGVGGSDGIDQSPPRQTAPQQVGFGSDLDEKC